MIWRRSDSILELNREKAQRAEIALAAARVPQLEEELTQAQLALCDTYESSDRQLTELQLAACELYEQNSALLQKVEDLEARLSGLENGG